MMQQDVDGKLNPGKRSI